MSLTPKMHKIADDIGQVICDHYDNEYLSVLFSSGFRIEDIIIQVLVLCCRYAYLTTAEKHPLKYYIDQDNLDLELARKELKRVFDYVNEKFHLESIRLMQTLGDSFPRPEMNLTKKPGRYPEYEFSAFQYWEGRNIHDMGLVKAIIERRIPSSKKVSVDRFLEFSDDYDNAVKAQKELFGTSAENTVFSSLQFFTLQTKYSFDYFYELANQMESLNITDFPDMRNRLMAIAGSYKCDAILPDINPNAAADEDRMIQYPLIIQRQRFTKHIVSDPEDGLVSQILGATLEAGVLINAIRSHMHIGGIRLPLLVAQETTIDDWASVFELFNVFQTFVPDKDWTDQKIKSVRKMYDLTSLDYKRIQLPENRP